MIVASHLQETAWVSRYGARLKGVEIEFDRIVQAHQLSFIANMNHPDYYRRVCLYIDNTKHSCTGDDFVAKTRQICFITEVQAEQSVRNYPAVGKTVQAGCDKRK